jgi:hypothetical protein
MITQESWKQHKTLSNAIDAEIEAGATLPIEVSPEVYHDMLGCVPPYSMKDRPTFDYALSVVGIEPETVTHLFLVGEPSYHNDKGEAMCATFFIRGDRFYYAGQYAAKESS